MCACRTPDRMGLHGEKARVLLSDSARRTKAPCLVRTIGGRNMGSSHFTNPALRISLEWNFYFKLCTLKAIRAVFFSFFFSFVEKDVKLLVADSPGDEEMS